MSMPKQNRQRGRNIFLPPRAQQVEMPPELDAAMRGMQKRMFAKMAEQMDRDIYTKDRLLKLMMEVAEREKLREAPTKPPKPTKPKPRRYLLLLPPRK